MSTNESHISDRPGASIAGFLAVAAIFLACYGITQRPVRIEPAAAIVAVVAAGMAGPRQRKIATVAIAFAGAGFVLGMVSAVLTNHPLW